MSITENIKALPMSDRPYEKLLRTGPETLTDSELLAIILRSGTKKRNVLSVSRMLLGEFEGKLSRVFNAGLNELVGIEGIGKTKAVQLSAVGELARRVNGESETVLFDASKPEAIGRLLIREIGHRNVETFRVILLDKKLKITGMRDISKGTVDRTIVHPRDVFSYAVREMSYAVIVAHNHPSGDLKPSAEDVNLTKRLIDAGKVLGIEVLDHFVVGKNGYLSMNVEGIIAGLVSAA